MHQYRETIKQICDLRNVHIDNDWESLNLDAEEREWLLRGLLMEPETLKAVAKDNWKSFGDSLVGLTIEDILNAYEKML